MIVSRDSIHIMIVIWNQDQLCQPQCKAMWAKSSKTFSSSQACNLISSLPIMMSWVWCHVSIVGTTSYGICCDCKEEKWNPYYYKISKQLHVNYSHLLSFKIHNVAPPVGDVALVFWLSKKRRRFCISCRILNYEDWTIIKSSITENVSTIYIFLLGCPNNAEL